MLSKTRYFRFNQFLGDQTNTPEVEDACLQIKNLGNIPDLF